MQWLQLMLLVMQMLAWSVNVIAVINIVVVHTVNLAVTVAALIPIVVVSILGQLILLLLLHLQLM